MDFCIQTLTHLTRKILLCKTPNNEFSRECQKKILKTNKPKDLIKKETPTQVCSSKFYEIFENIFFTERIFSGRLFQKLGSNNLHHM